MVFLAASAVLSRLLGLSGSLIPGRRHSNPGRARKTRAEQFKEGALESACLGSDPGFATCQLCNLGYVLNISALVSQERENHYWMLMLLG